MTVCILKDVQKELIRNFDFDLHALPCSSVDLVATAAYAASRLRLLPPVGPPQVLLRVALQPLERRVPDEVVECCPRVTLSFSLLEEVQCGGSRTSRVLRINPKPREGDLVRFDETDPA